MKKALLLMLGLVAGTASFANSTTEPAAFVSVQVMADQNIKLLVTPEAANALVTLQDAEGNVLYKKVSNLQKGLAQKFNLTDLANGTYTLVVNVGKQTTVKTVEVGAVPAQTVVKINP